MDDITSCNPQTNIFRSVKRLNPALADLECSQLLDKIIGILNNDDLGKEFYTMLSSNSGVKLIDLADANNNEWHVTTEFTCENVESGDSFCPDITCLISGLHLAFIEVKKPNNHDGILAKRDRINKRMRNKSLCRFINLTQFMIFFNNQEYDNKNRVPIQGAFYCCASNEKAFFNVFREADATFVSKYQYIALTEDTEKQVLKQRNCVVIKKQPDYETNKKVDTPTNRVLTSMLCRERFLFLLRYGFAYVNRTVELEDVSKITTLEKHVMRYQQLFASLAIRKKIS